MNQRSNTGHRNRAHQAKRAEESCKGLARWDVFLAAGLRQEGCSERNLALIRAIRELSLTIFAPQEELPLDDPLTPQEILQGNREGIVGSRLLLLVPKGAGAGVYYELGHADALEKHVVGFGEPPSNECGAIPIGRWLNIPSENRAATIQALQDILCRILRPSRESD